MSTLRTDPELGALFDDLDASLDGRPLEQLRPPPGPPPPRSSIRRRLAWGSAVGAVVAVLWSQASGRSETPSGMAERPAPPPVPPVAEPVVVVAAPAAEPSPRVVAAPARRPEPALPVPVLPVEAPPPLEPPAPEAAPVAGGSLAEEERAYRPAEVALAAGRWDDALAAADAYLARYPSGRWADKARLLSLEALVGAGRAAEVVEVAARLEALPALGTRRESLVILRAEALASLARCAEALELVEPLPRSAGATVRRVCR